MSTYGCNLIKNKIEQSRNKIYYTFGKFLQQNSDGRCQPFCNMKEYLIIYKVTCNGRQLTYFNTISFWSTNIGYMYFHCFIKR